jgi:hypothetical protein
MTWPTTKANTTHTDQDTDLISLARPDINQNILNVNNIIDHLDIGTPTHGDTMMYNSTTGVWEPSSGSGTSVMSFNTAISPGANATYSGGFTIDGSNRVSVVNTSTFTLPNGKYLIGVVEPFEVGQYGSNTGRQFDLTLKLNDAAGNTLATYTTEFTGFYFKDFDDTNIVTVSGNNNCYWTYTYADVGSNPTTTIIPIRIEKIS